MTDHRYNQWVEMYHPDECPGHDQSSFKEQQDCVVMADCSHRKTDWQKLLTVPDSLSKIPTVHQKKSARVLTGSDFLQTMREKEQKKEEEAARKEERKRAREEKMRERAAMKDARKEKARERAAMKDRKAREQEERKAQTLRGKASTRTERLKRKALAWNKQNDFSTSLNLSCLDLKPPSASSQLACTLPSPDYSFSPTPTPSEVACCLETLTTDSVELQKQTLDAVEVTGNTAVEEPPVICDIQQNQGTKCMSDCIQVFLFLTLGTHACGVHVMSSVFTSRQGIAKPARGFAL